MKDWIFKQGDAFDLIKALKPESIDCVTVDYPYESLEKHRAIGTTTRLSHSSMSSNDWFAVVPNSRLPEMLLGFYRVMKRNSHLYMFSDDETSNHIWSVNQMLNARTDALVEGADGRRRRYRMKWWKRIVWDKVKIGMGYHYRSRHENICFMEKGKRRLNNLGVPDVLEFERVRRGYPAEKPEGLLRVLIQNSTESGGTVLDPFCGSGSAGAAALSVGRRFIGFDIRAEAKRATEERLACVSTSETTLSES